MQVAEHKILGGRTSGSSTRRAAIIGTVALLHVGAAYMLVSGMAQRIAATFTPKDIEMPLPEKQTPPKTQPPPPLRLNQPIPTTPPIDAPKPVIDVAPDDPPFRVPPPPPTQPQPQPLAIPDSAAAGIPGTHTTPPYPAFAARTQHFGTVLLQLQIAADGTVTQASVLHSSGFDELDQAAVSWVTAHWKYRPAIRSGVAVAAQAQAAVKFDLTQANR